MEEYFGRIFLGGFFGRGFFGRIVFMRNSLFYFNVEGLDLFVKILSKSRRKEGRILDP